MKRIILSVLFILFVGIPAVSCLKEDIVSKNNDKLTNKSAITDMLMRVSRSSTAKNTKTTEKNWEECFTVDLPVTLSSDGEFVTIVDQADYVMVLNALENIDDDQNTIAFEFPISIVFADGTAQTINNTAALVNVLDGCHFEDDEDDIECFEIHYPLSITFFDATDAGEVVIFNNDAELFAFLDDLEDDESFTIAYPATITDADGEIITINNNDQLESYLEEADNQCGDQQGENEDDDDNDDSDENED
ncbi:hypothetical protein [Flavobacterium pedocola]